MRLYKVGEIKIGIEISNKELIKQIEDLLNQNNYIFSKRGASVIYEYEVFLPIAEDKDGKQTS